MTTALFKKSYWFYIEFCFLALVLILIFVCSASAQQPQPYMTPMGYCQLSFSTASSLSSCTTTIPGGTTIPGVPSGATYAAIANEGTAFRWLDDGETPTTSRGMPVPAGSGTAPTYLPEMATASKFQAIPQSGTTILNILFYR